MEAFRNNILGKSTPVLDAKLKVTGQLRYADDLLMPGMLYGKVLFSPLPHAEIETIDTTEAEKLAGVHAVVCYRDSPNRRYNGNGEDSDVLPSELIFDRVVRYAGDKVAAVAAETPEIAAEAVRLIKVTYKELPFYLDPEEAAKPDAYPIHETGNIMEEVNLSAGDVEKALKEADYVFEDRFEVPAVYHAPLEPHVSVASYEADGKLTVYTPTQDVFGQRKNLAKIFDMPMSKVRVVSPAMGGGFGGKIDLVTEPVSALLSMKAGRPVKVVYTRKEDMRSTTTRHAEIIYLRTGVNKDGLVTALDYKVYLSAGAQSGATMSVAWAAGGKFFKLFNIPNARYHAIPVYTNRMVAGAMRGFGSPQLFYALNNQFNLIARRLDMDITDFEYLNFHKPNTSDVNGEKLGNLRIRECVKRGKELFGWDEALKEQELSRKNGGRYRIGVGMAAAPHGSSLFGIMPDTCGVMIKMNEDGSLTMFTGVSDMGNGSNTLQRLIIAEILGVTPERIAVVKTDTESTLFDVGAYASRGAYVGGGAAEKIAKKARAAIKREAAELLSCPAREIALSDNKAYRKDDPSAAVTMKRIAEHAHEKERDISVSGMFGTKAAPISGGAHFVKLRIDLETGKVEPLDYLAIHDVGKPLNPMGLEGQVHGGIQMGLGYALSEGVVLDEKGAVKGTGFKSAGLFRAEAMPRIRVEFLDSYEKTGPFGAKSVGECATVPSAGAVANAVSNALNKEIFHLPIRAEEIKKYAETELTK